MKRLLIFILFLHVFSAGRSQTAEIPVISADRPGSATPPALMQVRIFQIESGFSYEKDTRNDSFQETILFNTSLFRYGLSRNSEIRLRADYAKIRTETENIAGVTPLTIGTKLLVAESKRFIPRTSFLFNLTLPWFGEKSLRPEALSPSFYLLMQNKITGRSSLTYNIGIEFDVTNAAQTVYTAIYFSYNITDRFSGFIENYNSFPDNMNGEYFSDFGFSYLLKNNIQIDISGNVNLTDITDYYMLNFGIAWMLFTYNR